MHPSRAVQPSTADRPITFDWFDDAGSAGPSLGDGENQSLIDTQFDQVCADGEDIDVPFVFPNDWLPGGGYESSQPDDDFLDQRDNASSDDLNWREREERDGPGGNVKGNMDCGIRSLYFLGDK